MVIVFIPFQVYNVHYTMSINGKVQEGSMEIDTGNNLETFKTGSGSEEAVEVHDFQIVSTVIQVFQIRHSLPLNSMHMLAELVQHCTPSQYSQLLCRAN